MEMVYLWGTAITYIIVGLFFFSQVIWHIVYKTVLFVTDGENKNFLPILAVWYLKLKKNYNGLPDWKIYRRDNDEFFMPLFLVWFLSFMWPLSIPYVLYEISIRLVRENYREKKLKREYHDQYHDRIGVDERS